MILELRDIDEIFKNITVLLDCVSYDSNGDKFRNKNYEISFYSLLEISLSADKYIEGMLISKCFYQTKYQTYITNLTGTISKYRPTNFVFDEDELNDRLLKIISNINDKLNNYHKCTGNIYNVSKLSHLELMNYYKHDQDNHIRIDISAKI